MKYPIGTIVRDRFSVPTNCTNPNDMIQYMKIADNKWKRFNSYDTVEYTLDEVIIGDRYELVKLGAASIIETPQEINKFKDLSMTDLISLREFLTQRKLFSHPTSNDKITNLDRVNILEIEIASRISELF